MKNKLDRHIVYTITRKWHFFLLWIFLSISNAYSREAIKTNLELMSDAVEKISYTFIQELPFPKNAHVYLVQDDVASADVSETIQEDAVSKYCRQQLIQNLFKAQIKMISEKDAENIDYALSISRTGGALQYRDVKQKGFFGTRLLARAAHVKLLLEVADLKNHEIIYFNEISDAAEDTIRFSDIDYAEQGGYILGNPAIPISTKRGYRRWFDPLVIVSSISVVVYLFYAIRS